MSPRRASAAGLAAPHGGGRACGACANLASDRVAAPTNALRMALTARCSATWTSARSRTRPPGCPRAGRVWCSVLTAGQLGSLRVVSVGVTTPEAIKEQRRGSPASVTTSRDLGVPTKGSLTGTPYPLAGGSSLMVMESRNEIRTFLASRRAMITSEQAGVATFGEMRRVPSLRPQLHRSQPLGWTAFNVD